MRRSVARYLVAGAVLALVVNVAINAATGWALYAKLPAVPLTGDTSIAGDTIVGAFLIAFFTLLIVAPATRREIRSGRVASVGGRPRRLTRWLERRPLLGAIAGGLASAVLVGGGAVAIVGALGAAPLSVGAFLAFKVGFAGAWGALAAALVAALAIAGEPPAPVDDRWCRDTAPPALAYPFDYVDKGGLAVSSARHGCSGTPTWQLVVHGVPDPAAVRAALGDVLARYPALTTRVQALDAIPEYARRFRYAGVAQDVASIFELVDLRGQPSAALDALIRDVWNRDLDQFRDAPIALTMAITADDRCHLLFRQHHGIADGRAFIGLLADFARFVAAREAGHAPDPAALTPIARRGELEALQLSRATRVRYAIAGFGSLLRSIAKAILRPSAMLVQNESNDYTGANGAVRWVVSDAALDGWAPARKAIGASLTSLLLGALVVATERWHRALDRPLGGRVNASIVMETRPRDGSFESFANHLATLEAELRLDRTRELDPRAAVRSIHAQVKRQLARHRPFKRLVCERALVAGMPLDKLRELVFAAKRPAYNLNLSNLIALDFAPLADGTWRVDEVLITTPVTPRSGIVVTVIRYHGRLCFNFNYSASVVTPAQVRDFARELRAALESITGHAAAAVDTAALDVI